MERKISWLVWLSERGLQIPHCSVIPRNHNYWTPDSEMKWTDSWRWSKAVEESWLVLARALCSYSILTVWGDTDFFYQRTLPEMNRGVTLAEFLQNPEGTGWRILILVVFQELLAPLTSNTQWSGLYRIVRHQTGRKISFGWVIKQTFLPFDLSKKIKKDDLICPYHIKKYIPKPTICY